MTEPKVPCHRCKKDVRPIIKFGGILCGECRIIIYYPGTEGYLEAVEKVKGTL